MKKFTILLFLFHLSKLSYAQYCSTNLGGAICPSAGVIISNVTLSNSTLNNSTTACNFINGSNISTFPATGTTTATLNQGLSYNLTVTVINGGPALSVWIDYNKDGIFSASEWNPIGLGGFAVSSSFITIPNNSLLGQTGMRIRSNSNGFPNGANDACSNFVYGETEDYTITIAPPLPCGVALNAGTTVSSHVAVCDSVPFTLSLQGATQTAGLTYKWQNSSDSLLWNTVNGATASQFSTSISASTYYRCIVYCNSDSAISLAIKVNLKSDFCYCETNLGGTTCLNLYQMISNVTISNSTLNNSTTSCNYYNGSNHSLFPDQGNTTATLNKGVSYTLSVTAINGAPIVSAWIDYNQDGVFSSTEWYQVGTSGSATSSISIYIPPTALEGKTGMRIRTNSGGFPNGAADACSNFAYGETEDYLIRISSAVNCSGTLNAGSAVTSNATICSAAPFTLSLQGSTPSSGSLYQWQSSSDSINWVSINGAYSDTLITSLLSSTFYRCIVYCNLVADTSSTIKVSLKASGCYCVLNLGGSTCPATNYIKNVSIAGTTLNNSNSTCNYLNGSQYSSFIDTGSTTAILYQGITHYLTVTPFNGNTWLAVWIDYNQDNVFSPSEWTPICINSGCFTAKTIQLTIPANALPGKTGMRIRSRGITFTAADACTTFPSGETEDYLITIGASAPCNGIPAAGTAISNPSQACLNKPINLTLSNHTPAVGLSYRWQSSTDSLLWQDIVGATLYYYTTTQVMRTYYRCIVNCSNSGGIDTSIACKVNMNFFLNCYCPSFSGSAFGEDIGSFSFGPLQNGIAFPIVSNPTAINTYSNFYSLPLDTFLQGVYYPITIQQITQGAVYYSSNVNVFLDLNHDGVFSTPSELIFSGSTVTGVTNIVSGSCLLPYNTKLGVTGLRIIMNWSSGGTTQPNCGSYSYPGETEDYLVYIGRGNAYAGANQTSCYPNQAQLNAGDLGDANGIWSVSSGSGGSFSDSSSATSTFSGLAETNYVLKWTEYDSSNVYLSDDEMEVHFYAYPNATVNYSGVPYNCSGDSLLIYTPANANYTYQWMLNGTTISGATDSAYTVLQTDSMLNFSVLVTNSATCTDTSASLLVNPPTLPVPICICTVDTLSHFNLIVWEKPLVAGIDSFRIYREDLTNIYQYVCLVLK